jgi:hypothetical protein
MRCTSWGATEQHKGAPRQPAPTLQKAANFSFRIATTDFPFTI